MTAEQIVTRELAKATRTDYGKRHATAWNANTAGIPSLILSLGGYADKHSARNGAKVGTDGVLGRYWRDGARAVLGLLNGELGNLDGALTERTLRAIAEHNGVNLDE